MQTSTSKWPKFRDDFCRLSHAWRGTGTTCERRTL